MKDEEIKNKISNMATLLNKYKFNAKSDNLSEKCSNIRQFILKEIKDN